MPIKILILTQDFSPHTETFIYNDALALQKLAEVKIVCFHRHNEKLRPFTPVEQIPYQRSWLLTKWHNLAYKLDLRLNFKNKNISRELSTVLRNYQPDVLHLHFGIQALPFLDNLHFSGPIFITFHGYDATKLVKKSTIYRKRLRDLFMRKNIFPLATSASLLEYMARFGIRSSRSRVLYSGIDLNFFKPVHTPANARPIAFSQISSFQAKKGHRYLLEAFQLLSRKYPENDMKLILAGGGYLEDSIKSLTAKMDLSDIVQFRGWITPAQAVTLLRETDVFVHPSITPDDGNMESTTVAILEAMAMELPIFSTFHSGIPEIVEDGVNGLLAKEKDVEAYVGCLEKLMDWGRLPRNRQKIADHFSQEAHIQTLLNFYEQALMEAS